MSNWDINCGFLTDKRSLVMAKYGLVNFFAWRPHIDHLHFIYDALKKSSHKVSLLSCDGSLPTCYDREIKGGSRLQNCMKCTLGGVRSFASSTEVVSLKNFFDSTINHYELDCTSTAPTNMCLSSAATIHRLETDLEQAESAVIDTIAKLSQTTDIVFKSVCNWIKREKIERVICFNGRVDVTRAVIEACRSLGTPFSTHERSWFGPGIQLIYNDNCLSPEPINKINKDFCDVSLSRDQCIAAIRLIAERFGGQNKIEWRLYNPDRVAAKWPTITTRKRILVVPSSRNEFMGSDHYQNEWSANTEALSLLFGNNDISPSQVVVRGHPNWDENIGVSEGKRSNIHYTNWCSDNNIHYIDSSSSLSTYDLIKDADIVILNGGSSAVEAGVLGKHVVCIGNSWYRDAKFAQNFLSLSDLKEYKLIDWDLSRFQIISYTLRYIYNRLTRFPLFTDQIILKSSTEVLGKEINAWQIDQFFERRGNLVYDELADRDGSDERYFIHSLLNDFDGLLQFVLKFEHNNDSELADFMNKKNWWYRLLIGFIGSPSRGDR